jgi:hypothetical protein
VVPKQAGNCPKREKRKIRIKPTVEVSKPVEYLAVLPIHRATPTPFLSFFTVSESGKGAL